MNKVIVNNHNNTVGPNDIVYFLGDFCFRGLGKENHKDWLDKLNGTIYTINGNHDIRQRMKTTGDAIIITHHKKRIKLFHDPKYADPRYEFNFCGHTHKEPIFQEITIPYMESSYIVNLCCELWDYRPVTFNTIMKEFNKWKKNKKVLDF